MNNNMNNNIPLLNPENIKNKKFPHNLHLRLMLNDTQNSRIQEIIALIKNHYIILDVTYQDNSIDLKNNNKENNISLNITHPEYQNQLIEEYLKNNTPLNNKMIEMIKRLNITANDTLDQNYYENLGTWKLLKLEFSNLYSYGLNNVIDFSNYKGIVGVIAPNHMGKSALIDIILYTLFDKFPRKGTLKDIINNRKTSFYSKITFQIGEWNYTIEKIGSRTKVGTSCKANFYRIHTTKNIKEILDEDTLAKTKSVILKYIGDYDDIIQTNISLQHNNCNFIDAENTARRKELERVLRIGIINQLIKRVTSTMNEKQAIYKHLQKNI